MRRRHLPVVAVIFLAWTAVAADAHSVPPRLLTVGGTNFHVSATFQAPDAHRVFFEVATNPTIGTNAEFLPQYTTTRTLTGAEIAAGSYVDPNQIAPGHYWAMLSAYTPCKETPTPCSNGPSNVIEFTIAPPAQTYRGLVHVYTDTHVVTLGLRITPAGAGPTPYRVCWRTAHHQVRCAGGSVLDGSWFAPGTDYVKVRLADMRRRTNFTWYVGGTAITTRSASTIPE